MIVAAELPETRLQVEVPVEAQRAVAAQGAAELVRRRVSHALGAARGGGDEAVARGDLLMVQQVGATVVAHPGPVGAESQLKVHERAGGDDRKHACQEEEKVIPTALFLPLILRDITISKQKKESRRELEMMKKRKAGV